MGDIIPIIDFAKVSQLGWQNLTDSDWTILIDQVYQAVSKVGFMYIVNHGINPKTIEAAFTESHKFFSLPDATKNIHSTDNSKIFRGHTKKDTEIANKSVVLFESFLVEVPDKSYKIPEVPQLVSALENLRRACQPTTQALLLLTGKVLKLEDEHLILKAYNKGQSDQVADNNSTMRANYYPALPEGVEVDPSVVRGAEHKDWGNFTLLFQDSIGGLQVKTVDDKWINATPLPGSLLVNTGDIMEFWTGGVFRATPHRVLMPDNEIQRRTGRQSVVFFANADNDTLITPLRSERIDWDGKSFEPILFKDYYAKKLADFLKK